MPDSTSHTRVSDSCASNPVKTIFVSDMVLGNTIADFFILSAAQQGQARNGPYWRLEFKDSTGGIGGKIWSPQSLSYPDLAPGMAVWVEGRITSYRDKLELSIEGLRILDEVETSLLDMSDYMPASPHHPDKMFEELIDLAQKTLSHKPWRKLILSVLNDEAISEGLRLAPAAKAMHHAYAGGLLEHTLSVARICLLIADNYPHIDRQVLFAGAVCHDLGKLWELTPGLSIDYTTQGRLIGHISLVMDKLGPFIKKSGLEPELADHLQHLILSHHGTYEFGSPRLPSTAEALLLHYADNIDAKLQQFEAALAGVEENGWSAYTPSLERYLFRPMATPSTLSKARANAKGTNSSQPLEPLSLFSQCSLPSKE